MKNITMPGAKYRARISASGYVTVKVELPFEVDLRYHGCKKLHRVLGNLRNAVASSIRPLWRWRSPITVDLGETIDRKLRRKK